MTGRGRTIFDTQASFFLSLHEDPDANTNVYRWFITLAALKNVNLLTTVSARDTPTSVP